MNVVLISQKVYYCWLKPKYFSNNTKKHTYDDYNDNSDNDDDKHDKYDNYNYKVNIEDENKNENKNENNDDGKYEEDKDKDENVNIVINNKLSKSALDKKDDDISSKDIIDTKNTSINKINNMQYNTKIILIVGAIVLLSVVTLSTILFTYKRNEIINPVVVPVHNEYSRNIRPLLYTLTANTNDTVNKLNESTTTTDNNDFCPAADTQSREFLVGIISAYLCATLYMSARIPQIVHNYRLKKTDDILYTLFILPITANFQFNISIWLPDNTGLDKKTFWLARSPYIIGTLLSNLVDFVNLFQNFYYRRQNRLQKM